MRLLKIDADHVYWPEFRALVNKGNHKDVVRIVIIKLWVWLAYMSEVDDYGFISIRHKEALETEFKEGPFGKKVDWFEELVAVGLLKYDDGRGGHWCQRFRALHEHLERGYWSRTEYLTAKHVYHNKVNAFKKNIQGLLESIMKESWFEFALRDRTKLSEVSHDAIWLIYAVDSALGMPERTINKFTPSLLVAACSIVSAMDMLKLKAMIRGILKYRNSPKCPPTTELVLQNWDAVVSLVLGGYDSKQMPNLREDEEASQED